MLSLRTSISSIVQNFEVTLAPGEDGVTFDKHFLDTQLITLRPLQLVFKPRTLRLVEDTSYSSCWDSFEGCGETVELK